MRFYLFKGLRLLVTASLFFVDWFGLLPKDCVSGHLDIASDLRQFAQESSLG